jgi:hypothetical protein
MATLNSPRVSTLLLVAATLAGVAFSTSTAVRFASLFSCRSDFNAFYAGGKLAFTDGLYDRQSELLIYKNEVGCPEYNLPFVRPAYFAALLSPLASLPYSTARAVWYGICLFCICAFAAFWHPHRLLALAVCSWSFPLTMGFIIAQDLPLLLFAVGGCIWAWRRNMQRTAGIFLLMGAMKPHLVIFFAFWVVARRPVRFTTTLFLGLTSLLCLSFLSSGMHWPIAWLESAAHPTANQAKYAMISLIGLQHALHTPGFATAIVGLAVALTGATVLRRVDLPTALCLSLPISLLLSPHSYIYDTVACIPLLLLVLGGDFPAWLKAIAFALALPISHFPPAFLQLMWTDQLLMPCLVAGTLWHLWSVSTGPWRNGDQPGFRHGLR